MSREGALWIGGLEPYMDEDFLMSSFRMCGESPVSIKIIKNKFTGEPASYGFINFDTDPAALMAMHKLNGKMIPNSHPPVRFKLNHNSTRLMPGEREYSIWVGDIAPEVDDLQLFRFFSARFQSVKSAKVVSDNSGVSKGYGFIRFGNEQEQQTALISMMGISGLGTRPLKVSIAVPKPKGDVMGNPTGGSAFPSSLSSSSSLTIDNLSVSTLAAVISNASGNPNAGAAVVAEAQAQEYKEYWERYSQQYWTQYEAWSRYQQQQQYEAEQQQYEGEEAYWEEGGYYNATEAEAMKPPRNPSKPIDIFEGDELDLVEHSEALDYEYTIHSYLRSSEELWDALDNSLWGTPQEMEDEEEEEEQGSNPTGEEVKT